MFHRFILPVRESRSSVRFTHMLCREPCAVPSSEYTIIMYNGTLGAQAAASTVRRVSTYVLISIVPPCGWVARAVHRSSQATALL